MYQRKSNKNRRYPLHKTTNQSKPSVISYTNDTANYAAKTKLLSAFLVIFYNDVVHITCSLSHISKLIPFWYDAFSFQHCTASLRPYSEELTYQDMTVKLVQRHYHLHFSQTTFNSCNVIIHAMYKAVQNRCP